MIVDKQAQLAHKQKVINNQHHKLMLVEIEIRSGASGMTLQGLEKYRSQAELRLMELYGTEKYGVVN